MKKAIIFTLLLAFVATLQAEEYRLKRVILVEGRQGIAADSAYYYVSGSTVLYKYTKDGKLLISADDGDAELEEPDNLYIADLSDGRSYAKVEAFRQMDDFRRAGEIEGLSIDPQTGELLVLANRGSRIVLGMVKGFYPGYDREISEVYVYEKVK